MDTDEVTEMRLVFEADMEDDTGAARFVEFVCYEFVYDLKVDRKIKMRLMMAGAYSKH